MSPLRYLFLILVLTLLQVGGCSSRPDLTRQVDDDGVRLSDAGWRFEKIGGWDVAFHLERSSELPRMVDMKMVVVDPSGQGADQVDGWRFGDTFSHARAVASLDDSDTPEVSSVQEAGEAANRILEDARENRRGDWLEVDGAVVADDADLLVTTLVFRAVRDGVPLEGRSTVKHTAVLDFGGRIASWTVEPE